MWKHQQDTSYFLTQNHFFTVDVATRLTEEDNPAYTCETQTTRKSGAAVSRPGYPELAELTIRCYPRTDVALPAQDSKP